MSKKGFKRFLKWFAALVAVVLVVAGGFVANLVWFKPFSIDLFYERVFIEFGLKNPELMTSLRILESFGYYGHNDDLTDASDEFALSLIAKAQRDLDTLRRYDRSKQTEDQLLSTDILAWFLEDQIAAKEFLYHSYPVNQMFGVQSSLPTFMATMHQVHTQRDAEQYIARLNKFPWKFGQVIEGLKTREEKGILPPKFVVHRVLDEMRSFIEKQPHENLLYTSFAEKLEQAEDVDPDSVYPLLEETTAAINTSVYSSYKRLIEYFEALESKTSTDDGVWKHPNGEAYYAYALRSNTTTGMSPEEVHQVGLAEVDRLVTEMDTLLDGLGQRDGTVGERIQTLSTAEDQLYPDTDEGREACLADYQRIIDEAQPKLAEIFDLRPKTTVKVERIPVFKEATSAGAYYNPPALDGSRPGIFYVNLRDMKEVPKFAMKTLEYHEGIPGHHFQFALQQERSGGPTFRKVLPFTAYSEGWGLYAERIAGEYGFHDSVQSDLGRLQAELFRAVRLVVDTGIHYKRWTRERAIVYMENTTGMPHGDVVSEIERYIVMPGQACAYKIGQLKILELRAKAKQALGDRFDIRQFHNTILKEGSVPLSILEMLVDRYIEAGSATG